MSRGNLPHDPLSDVRLEERVFGALGIDPESPLFGSESWIAWSVLIVFAAQLC